MEGNLIYFVVAILIVSALMFIFLRMYFQKRAEVSTRLLEEKETANQSLATEIRELHLQREQLIGRAVNAESKMELLSREIEAYKALQAEHQILTARFAKAEEAYRNLNEKLNSQKEEFDKMSVKFKDEFTVLAQSILEEKSTKFTQVNEQKMNAILNPLQTQINEFKKKVEETYDKESKERFSLEREVQKLVTMTQLVSDEANNLTTALKGSSKKQGDWGELILETILENSGLVKNREFFLQEFLRDAAGNVIKDEEQRGLQPDAIIYYPDKRKIIVDSKVSLVAWDAYNAATERELQNQHLKNHLKSIRTHIDGLSKKNYPKYAEALNYVLMFIPIEPAFLEALRSDAGLWKYAYDKNILLVCPTNLYAVLRIVADLWKVNQQSANAIEIAKRAGLLYDKFVNFITNFENLGKKIADADRHFQEAKKQLNTGSGNLSSKIEELKKMGAKAEKQIPDNYLSESTEPDLFNN